MYVYVSTVMKYAFADILVSRYPGLVWLFPPTPNIFFLQILNFNSKGVYEIASIFDM